jgi:hypothetical protein
MVNYKTTGSVIVKRKKRKTKGGMHRSVTAKVLPF